tara:strand:+ start:278 stop:847 length:570 start_codon:yes stop_codon:yes gene_type:complete
MMRTTQSRIIIATTTTLEQQRQNQYQKRTVKVVKVAAKQWKPPLLRRHHHHRRAAASSSSREEEEKKEEDKKSDHGGGKRLLVLTFDLDDTIWPTAPVVTRANEQYIRWLQTRVEHFPETNVVNALMKGIREEREEMFRKRGEEHVVRFFSTRRSEQRTRFDHRLITNTNNVFSFLLCDDRRYRTRPSE